MRRIAIIVLMLLAARMAAPREACAQWTKVLQLTGTRGASAFFFNAHEGVIGTGEYNPNPKHGLAIRMYWTSNGGNTWTQSFLPRQNLIGQITDIFFRDRKSGWATLKERVETGWSGIYHTTDGGRSWKYVVGADYAVAIRETKRGVFYTDHGSGQIYPYFGVVFSSDTGKTWRQVGTSLNPLGLDFLDDATGMATSSGLGQQPHLMTTDSGKTWNSIDVVSEAWGVIGDPATKKFILSSERNQTTDLASIIQAPIATGLESGLRSYGRDALTGGIQGWKSCLGSVFYVQGYVSDGPKGLIRTKDGGITWQYIGGPVNVQDTRFAVTGRGAVVFAFDSTGGVWKTGFGGDTTLTPSALKYVTIQNPFGVTSARRCDSTYATFRFGYLQCDSSRIVRVTFLNDSLGELSVPGYSNDFHFYSLARNDSLNILYQPSSERSWRAQVRITLTQPDGYEEDTVVSFDLRGLPPQERSVTFLDTTAPKVIDFGNVSICTGDERPVVISNEGCAEIAIDQMATSKPVFSVASSFRPFTLDPGSKRTFLIRYSPSTPSSDNAVLVVHHNGVTDTLLLKGSGIAPSLALQLTKPDTVSSSLCDTATFGIQIRNVACKAFKIISATIDTPFTASQTSQLDSIHTGESTTLALRFAPNVQGPVRRSVTIKVAYDGSQEYDTTFNIVGVGTSGLPGLAVNGDVSHSAFTIDMGSVSFCSDALDTVLFLSKGCALTEITDAIFETGGSTFTIERSPVQTVSHDVPDTMIVRYHPRQPGADIGTVLLTTSAGVRTIEFTVNVTSDPGNIQLTSTQSASALTCDSAALAISVTNGTCDSVTIVAAKMSGTNPNDFILRSSFPIGLNTRAQTNIALSFQPQDSLARTATAVLTIKRSDGTTFDTNVSLTAIGIGVPVIPVQLLHAFETRTAGLSELLEVFSDKGSGPLKVGALDFTLAMNTDLMTPEEIVDLPQDFVFNNGTITLTHDSAMIHCELLNDVTIKPDQVLCQIVCHVFVTDTFNTVIALHNPIFRSVSGGSSCIKTLNLDHDSGYVFTLKYQCSDSTLKDFIKYKQILVDRISPNPTGGVVTVTLDVPGGYHNDASLQVYDALGVRLKTLPLAFDNAGKKNVTLDLSSKSSGVCYVVLKSASGVSTSRVMIQK